MVSCHSFAPILKCSIAHWTAMPVFKWKHIQSKDKENSGNSNNNQKKEKKAKKQMLKQLRLWSYDLRVIMNRIYCSKANVSKRKYEKLWFFFMKHIFLCSFHFSQSLSVIVLFPFQFSCCHFFVMSNAKHINFIFS